MDQSGQPVFTLTGKLSKYEIFSLLWQLQSSYPLFSKSTKEVLRAQESTFKQNNDNINSIQNFINYFHICI